MADNKRPVISKEAAEKYKKRKKEQERILEETKPGSILKNNPDYGKIMKIIDAGG